MNPDTIVPTIAIVIGVGVLCISILLNVFIVVMLYTRTPEWTTLFTAALRGRPLTMMHHMNMVCKLYAPKNEGEKGEMNTFKVPSFLGIKFHPDRIAVESFYQRKLVNYFTKSPNAVSAKQAKAIQDFHEIMGHYGVDVTIPVIDGLFVADLNKDLMIKDQLTDDQIDTLKEIKKELEDTVVSDGAFVFQTVKDFVHTMGFQTSKQLDETKSILNDNAINNAAHQNGTRDYVQIIIWGIMILVFMAIAKQMFFPPA